MKEIQPLQELLSGNNELELLDKIAIKGKNAIEVRIALGLELFFPPTDTQVLYPQFGSLLEDYYQRFTPQLNCYGLTGSNRVMKIPKDFIKKLHNKLQNFNYKAQYEAYVFHSDTNKPEIFNATPWQAVFWGRPPEDNKLSTLNAMMAISDGAGGFYFDTMLEMTVQWCNKVKPIHGSAGYCFAYPLGSPSAGYAYSLMQRFPGIDHSDMIKFVIQTKGVFNRLKGINWLTILGDPLVEELGGVKRCKAQLEPDCHVETYNGGVIIMAGPLPQLGDSYQKIIPDCYKKVANFIKPVRFEKYRGNYLKLDNSIDGFEAFMKWNKRFDG